MLMGHVCQGEGKGTKLEEIGLKLANEGSETGKDDGEGHSGGIWGFLFNFQRFPPSIADFENFLTPSSFFWRKKKKIGEKMSFYSNRIK